MFTSKINKARIQCSLLLLISLPSLAPAGAADLASFNMNFGNISPISKATVIEPISTLSPVSALAPIAQPAPVAPVTPVAPVMPAMTMSAVPCLPSIVNTPINPLSTVVPTIMPLQSCTPVLPALFNTTSVVPLPAPQNLNSAACPSPALPAGTGAPTSVLGALPSLPSLPGTHGHDNLFVREMPHLTPSSPTIGAVTSETSATAGGYYRDPLSPNNQFSLEGMLPDPQGRWTIFNVGNRLMNRAERAVGSMDDSTPRFSGPGQNTINAASSAAATAGSRFGGANQLPVSVPGTVDGQDIQTLVAVNSALSNAAQMHSQLTLFSSANQILQGARGQVITGKPGTLMSADKDIIILHKGALTVSSGEAPATVKTRCGELRIKERSVVVVDDQGKDLHVKAISGGENVVEIRSSSYKNNVVTAQSGKELIVSDSGIDEEELISTEGTEAQRSNREKTTNCRYKIRTGI
ncbi:MAG: hypothetical protein K2X77_31275 [Candidatus Obscuribacterales bacterium]|nr:hypothetical protein [Candidatus Obscuribacterales bacterium]